MCKLSDLNDHTLETLAIDKSIDTDESYDTSETETAEETGTEDESTEKEDEAGADLDELEITIQ